MARPLTADIVVPCGDVGVVSLALWRVCELTSAYHEQGARID